MTILSHNKIINVITATACALIFLANPLVQASHCCGHPRQGPQCDVSDQPVESQYAPIPQSYFQKNPNLGLIMDEVSYDSITVSHVKMNRGGNIIIVKPGETVRGNLNYSVDAANQELFHRHHLVVGLQGVGAQDCITHTYGIWDSKGKGTFSLKAPLEAGVYEVRYSFQEAATCEAGRSTWNSEMGEPSAFATIGAIIVE